ncbi:MAG: hypothetical protein JSS49_19040 [Planctomycetes bacterium]|nr:hypothetical protein [Planctomycetota bacterium]
MRRIVAVADDGYPDELDVPVSLTTGGVTLLMLANRASRTDVVSRQKMLAYNSGRC